MKKILIIAILLMFSISNTVLAENSGVNNKSNTVLGFEYQTEAVRLDNKGEVKDLGELKDLTIYDKADKKKNKEFKKIISQAEQTLKDALKDLSQYGYYPQDYSSSVPTEYTKMPLLDGDYIIWYKDTPIIAEYHADKSLMGFIRPKNISKSNKKITQVYYEYRLGYNTDSDSFGLKHVLFLDIENNKHISQYIYDSDGNLLCLQVNNDIYYVKNSRNMLVDFSKRKDYKNQIEIYNSNDKNELKKQLKVYKHIKKTVAAPFVFARDGVIFVGAVATAPIWLPLLYYMLSGLSVHY